MPLIFTYGTLQNTKIQKILFHRVLKGTPDLLTGFKKEKIKLGKYTYPILIPHNHSQPISGICYHLLTHELSICDAYEGQEYKRVLIKLHSNQKAWVYTKN